MCAIFETPPPSGTVHRWPRGALQFDVMRGAVEIAQACGKFRLMNGCSVNALSVVPWSSPPTRQMLLTRIPTTHGPGMTRPTAVGPSPHWPVRTTLLVAVGNEKIGPMPHVILPGLAAVKYVCS